MREREKLISINICDEVEDENVVEDEDVKDL